MLIVICERDALQAYTIMKREPTCGKPLITSVLVASLQRGNQRLDFGEGRTSPAQDWNPGDNGIQRAHEIKNNEHDGDTCCVADRLKTRNAEEHDSNESEERELAPALGERESTQAVDRLAACRYYARFERLGEIGCAARRDGA